MSTGHSIHVRNPTGYLIRMSLLSDEGRLDEAVFSMQACVISGAVLLCCDYTLTFSREVEYFWKAKLTPVALLFYVLRYAGLFNTIFVMLGTSIDWSKHGNLVS
ncbi:hypothetical protein B0H21DRAFT_528134 [Amylocystis lapponica]|nr:hypothetical protein B0H21DRAFT_528134 [Amylocystis lapponica]